MYDSNKQTWLNPNIEYIFNAEIIEYDMQDAGFSLIKQFKLLPEDKIRELSFIPKGIERHVAIGKIQRDDRIFSEALTAKFAEVRKVFITTNDIKDDDIISVKKDAIFTIGQRERLKFGAVQFAPKNYYSSYIRFSSINDLELYYSSDKIDFKGIGKHAVNRHRLYMIDFLRKLIPVIEQRDQRAKRYLKKFIDIYKQHGLDEEYYIEFNNLSKDINKLFNYRNLLIPLVQIVMKEVN